MRNSPKKKLSESGIVFASLPKLFLSNGKKNGTGTKKCNDTMNDYIRQLDSRGIEYNFYGDSILMFCPDCRAGESTGNKMTTVFLNVRTATTECRYCGQKSAWEDFLVKFSDKKPHQLQPTFSRIAPPEVEPRHTLAPPQSPPKLRLVAEILQEDFGEDEWLVDNLIPISGIVALSGNPGEFKTWLTIHIAASVAKGVSVFGKFPSRQRSVLVIDEENQLRHIKKRLQLMNISSDMLIYYLSFENFRADDSQNIEFILSIIKEKHISLVIIDSLVRVHRQQENDAGQMASVFRGLQKFTQAEAAILFTHHHRKQMGYYSSANPAQNLRGSSDILAVVDGHISVEKKHGEDILILRQNKARQSELVEPFEVNIVKDENGPRNFEYKGQHDEKKKKAEEAAEAIVAILRDGIKSRQELEKALAGDFSKGAVNKGIKIAQELGDIELVPKEELPEELAANNKKHYYRLTEEIDPPAP